MERLPVELLESIFRYCTVDDVLNAACCNKNFYSMLKPILWQSVKIPISSLSTKLEPWVENLKYTNHLNIDEDVSFSDLCKDGNVDNDEDEEKDDFVDEDKAMCALRGALDIGLILMRLMSYCDPLKVISLQTSVNGLCLESILDSLPHVKTLALLLKGDIESRKVSQLLKLEELELEIYCTLADDRFRDLVGGERLRSLNVHHHDTLPDEAFITISELTNMEELVIWHFICLGQNTVDISPLSRLKNLTHLTLKTVLTNDALRLLCQSLIRLKSLSLNLSYLDDDDGLSAAHHLTSLTHLSLEHCRGISTNCFLHLLTVPLKSIFFSTSIWQGEEHSVLSADVAGLNKIPTLEKVFVNGNTSASSRNSQAVITNSLCLNETWKLRLEKRGPEMNRTFTR